MKYLKLIAATGMAVGIAGTAHAFEFGGAELSYSYLNVDGGAYTQAVLRGSAEAEIGGAFIGQIDLASWRYDGADDGLQGAAVHLG